MILKQLAEDADNIARLILQEDLPPPMYVRRPVDWFLDLDSGGRPHARPFKNAQIRSGRHLRGAEHMMPTLTRAGTRPPPILLADTPAYVLGVGDDPMAVQKHADFVALVADCAAETDEPLVKAVATFLEKYEPGSIEVPQDLLPSHTLTFRVGNEEILPVHLPAVQSYWAKRARPRKEGQTQLQCLVCGMVGDIPEFLPLKIKGIPGGQTVGTSLVSANETVFESYGLTRARTSPVCDTCAERSHKALNALLASEDHHLVVGRLVYVFWSPSGWSPAKRLRPRGPTVDAGIIKRRLDQPRTGRAQHISHPEKFVAAALSASGGRAVVRSWLQTTVPKAEACLDQWENWQRLIQPDGGRPRYHSAYHLATSAYYDVNSEDCLQGTQALIESALSGKPLPLSLLSAAVRRNRAVGLPDSGKEALITYSRVALIKMVLASREHLSEGEHQMSEYERTEPNLAYHWGRLLAVLESIQRRAMERPGSRLNSTIVDRYYGAASTAPGTVFGRLLAGAQDHLKKIRGSMNDPAAAEALNQRLEVIVYEHLAKDGILPSESLKHTFTLKEQALFALGYYHERARNRFERRSRAEQNRAATPASIDDSFEAEETNNE
jgi:CRISPR-associated protein Csd1